MATPGASTGTPLAITAPSYAVSSHRTTFTFGSITLSCTDITFDESAPETNAADERVDVTTLDVANGGERVYAPLPITEPKDNTLTATKTINVAFIGSVQPAAGVTAVVTTNGATGNYKCTKSTITRKVGQYIEGTASFQYMPAATP